MDKLIKMDSQIKQPRFSLGIWVRANIIIVIISLIISTPVVFSAMQEEKPSEAEKWNAQGGRSYYIGDYDKAITYYEKALKIDLAVYGVMHAKVAIRFNNLGESWRAKGNYNKALTYLEKALKINRAIHGDIHQNVATSLNNLGVVWKWKGNYDKAISYYEKALKINLALSGSQNQKVIIRWNNLGEAWRAKGDYDRAIAYLEQAYEVSQKVLGTNHSYTKVIKQNLQRTKASQKKVSHPSSNNYFTN